MNGYEKEKLNTSLLEANGNWEVFDYLFVCLLVLAVLGLRHFAWAFL